MKFAGLPYFDPRDFQPVAQRVDAPYSPAASALLSRQILQKTHPWPVSCHKIAFAAIFLRKSPVYHFIYLLL